MAIIDQTGFRSWLNKKSEMNAPLHGTIYAAACFLLEETDDRAAVFEILRRTADRYPLAEDRPIPDREIHSAIDYALNNSTSTTPRWPSVSIPLKIHAATRIDGLDVLRDLSLATPPALASQAVPVLFPGDPLICVGASSSRFTTGHLAEFPALDFCQFIVPSPMSARTGKTQDGRESAHCLDNTGPRRFIVVEFDHGEIDDQASWLYWLATKAPLIAVVFSGGKSLHGWFLCDGVDETQVEEFFADAVRIGADPRLWTRSQFARLPGGLRGEVRQEIVFWNPEPLNNHDP